MPRTRSLPQAEAQLLDMNQSPPEVKVALEEAYRTSQTVELLESSFTDPGEDYTAILINGMEIYRQAGY